MFDFFGGGAQAQESDWDAGKLFHLLPTVSHDRALLKCSFREALGQAPEITADGRRITGRRTDSRGLFWEFDIVALKSGTDHKLEIRSEGRTLAEPWSISTFPELESDVGHVRIAFYTCAGGHDALLENNVCQPLMVKQTILSKLVSLKPQAIVDKGDHI